MSTGFHLARRSWGVRVTIASATASLFMALS
jgi:hypothetical protein